MNRPFSALLLTALGTAVVVTASAEEEAPAAAVDQSAVDRYIAELSRTVPPAPETVLAQSAPQDPKLSKRAARADRAEPIVDAAFAIAR